jgi:hypothetical protein
MKICRVALMLFRQYRQMDRRTGWFLYELVRVWVMQKSDHVRAQEIGVSFQQQIYLLHRMLNSTCLLFALHKTAFRRVWVTLLQNFQVQAFHQSMLITGKALFVYFRHFINLQVKNYPPRMKCSILNVYLYGPSLFWFNLVIFLCFASFCWFIRQR